MSVYIAAVTCVAMVGPVQAIQTSVHYGDFTSQANAERLCGEDAVRRAGAACTVDTTWTVKDCVVLSTPDLVFASED